MISLLVRLSLALFVLNLLLTPAEAFWGRHQSEGSKVVSKEQPKTLRGYSASLPAQNATRRGLGISAWGIVFLVVALILAGMGIYYFSVCYHACQPTKGKYDKMDLPSMA